MAAMHDQLTRPQAMRIAEQLYANGDGGWTVPDIRRYLADRGVSAAETTVRGWADPEWHANRIAYKRDYQRRWQRDRRAPRDIRALDSDAVLRRIRALRNARVPATSIARVITLDLVAMSHHDVRHALALGELPRGIRRRLGETA